MKLKLFSPKPEQLVKPLFPLALGLSKASIKHQRALIVEAVETGKVDALQVTVAAKAISKIFEGDKDDPGVLGLIKSFALTELDKFKNSKTIVYGADVSSFETGVQYDYSNDPIWNDLQNRMEALKTLTKQHEELLKNLPDTSKLAPHEVDEAALVRLIDPNTGEEYKPNRPIKTSTTSLKISFPKS